MNPLSDVEMVRVDSDRSVLLNKLNKCTLTRLLVTEADRGNILGFVNIYKTLGSTKEFTDLHDFLMPIRKLDAETKVTDAISVMQAEKQRIILVTRTGRHGRERPIGIVTMKDLVEELLGELAEW
jgi:CBS domain containing-hemolysin-like protein